MKDSVVVSADQDLERRVKNFLRRQHFPGLRTIEVQADKGVVTIRGRVNTFHERQLCIHCCQRVSGVVQLNDEVLVASPAEKARPSTISDMVASALAWAS